RSEEQSDNARDGQPHSAELCFPVQIAPGDALESQRPNADAHRIAGAVSQISRCEVRLEPAPEPSELPQAVGSASMYATWDAVGSTLLYLGHNSLAIGIAVLPDAEPAVLLGANVAGELYCCYYLPDAERGVRTAWPPRWRAGTADHILIGYINAHGHAAVP